ncbi:MAG: hypothetical protein JSR15_11530 [Proteobacteria bacterium]|nr:hypothetical protein [Pseudomonadota bacterium]
MVTRLRTPGGDCSSRLATLLVNEPLPATGAFPAQLVEAAQSDIVAVYTVARPFSVKANEPAHDPVVGGV